jgi:hypothetical protein
VGLAADDADDGDGEDGGGDGGKSEGFHGRWEDGKRAGQAAAEALG